MIFRKWIDNANEGSHTLLLSLLSLLGVAQDKRPVIDLEDLRRQTNEDEKCRKARSIRTTRN